MAITGLDLFAERFADHKDKYVLIGGSACFLNLGEIGVDFRATKDLDIVLIVDVDTLDADFAKCLWEFIHNAGYEIQQKSTGKPIFYRFAKPQDKTYPYMLELFSRRLENLSLQNESHLSPIPVEDNLTSLSAILINDDYYNLVLKYKKDEKGFSFVTVEALIPLKAKAYLDLRERKNKGEEIDKKDIKKHKNDVFRIVQLLSDDSAITVSEAVRNDLLEFIELSEKEPPDLKNLGIKGFSSDDIIRYLRRAYRLDE